MARSTRVTVADVRALLRLTGELHELPPDRETRVRHVLVRLGELVNAPVGSMQEASCFVPGRRSFPTAWAQVIGPPEACEVFRRFAHEAQNSGPTVAHLAAHPGRVFLRPEVVPDPEWFRSVVFNDFVRPGRIDMGAAGSFLLPRQGGVIGFAFNRPLRERRMGARERQILQIFSDEFGWFFRSVASRPESPSRDHLPPYLGRVLRRLMAGDSEKQVAIHLRLSRHTVHDYVKELYQRFGVSSRAELLIRVLRDPFGRTAWSEAGEESRDGESTIITPRRPAP